MSGPDSIQYEVPPELQDLLLEFTVCTLVEQPRDLVDFAVVYFTKLKEARAQGGIATTVSPRRPVGVISSEDDIISKPPPKLSGRRKSVFAEAYDPEKDKSEWRKVIHPKTDAQRRRLMEALKKIFLFRALDNTQLQDVVDAMFEKRVKRGDYVIRQGEDGDNFYVIESGDFEIFVKGNEDVKARKVGAYEGAGFFGELALMYNMPRAATIQASNDGTLWCMDRLTFRKIVLQSAFKKRQMYDGLLNGVPMLRELQSYERMNLCDALVPRTFKKGELIISQGDRADGMYFIEEGTVSITVNTKHGEKEINQVKTSGYFGEWALLTQKPRAANVRAVTDCKCAFLETEAFERLLGPCREIMQRNAAEYDKHFKASGLRPEDLR